MGQTWVYVLALRGGRYYVGVTSRLFHRLAEHFGGRGGRCTAENPPTGLAAMYSVPERHHDLDFEEHVTLLMMRALGRQYFLVQGGKFTDALQPHNHARDMVPDRPLCGCGVPCEVITSRGGRLYVCPRSQSIWKFVGSKTDFALAGGTCDYKTYVRAGQEASFVDTYPPLDQAAGGRRVDLKEYAFVDEAQDVLEALRDRYVKSDRLSVTAPCCARNCICYEQLVDVFECEIDRADVVSICNGVMRVLGGDGADKVAFYHPAGGRVDSQSSTCPSQSSPSQSVVVASLACLDADGDVMLVTDQSGTITNYACGLLDSIAAALPSLQYARANNMPRCVGCYKNNYWAVRADGGFKQLCKNCALDPDVMDRVVLQSNTNRMSVAPGAPPRPRSAE